MLGNTSYPYIDNYALPSLLVSSAGFFLPNNQFKQPSALIQQKPNSNAISANFVFDAKSNSRNNFAFPAKAAFEGFQTSEPVNNESCSANKKTNTASKDVNIKKLLKRKKKKSNRKIIKALARDLSSVLTANAKIQIYHCLFPDCPKFYDTFQKWKYHFDSHLNQREFICEFCMRGFNLKSNYKAHLNLHMDKTPKSQTNKYFKIEKVMKNKEIFNEGNDTNDISEDFTASLKRKLTD